MQNIVLTHMTKTQKQTAAGEKKLTKNEANDSCIKAKI